MKMILIVLTVIQVLGIISSTVLTGSLILGIQDMQTGILILAVLWVIWFGVKHLKKNNPPQEK